MPSPHDFIRFEETGDEVSDAVNCSETSTGILAGGIDVNNIGFMGQAVQRPHSVTSLYGRYCDLGLIVQVPVRPKQTV
jgi:hypothetical protein